MIEKKNISLKMTLDEWEEIEENYRDWLVEHRKPISRHAWMKMILMFPHYRLEA
jgi:hypothetical protein